MTRFLILSLCFVSLTATVIGCSAPAETPAAVTSPTPDNSNTDNASADTNANDGELTVQFAEARQIIEQRCTACHASDPEIKSFGSPAGGILFETPEQMKDKANRIRARAVDSKSMPIANRTNMTDEEREILGRWIAQGANIN